jgi:TFIIF-interacting CTD phosphatase-like protein
MKKINLVLDLDNTLICSVPMKEVRTMERNNHKSLSELKYKDMDDIYRVFYRPYLDEFLTYAFENFDVTVWTAASKDYASFIVDNIMIDGKKLKKKRRLKMFFYDDNCEQSQSLFKTTSHKDLRYLYNFKGYHGCNTLIIDDLDEVYETNSKQTLRAVYFNAKKQGAYNDKFLLETIDKLEEIKNNYNPDECIDH